MVLVLCFKKQKHKIPNIVILVLVQDNYRTKPIESHSYARSKMSFSFFFLLGADCGWVGIWGEVFEKLGYIDRFSYFNKKKMNHHLKR